MNRHEATVVRLLDGLSAASRDGGKMVEVSESDLTLLTTFAWVGVFAMGEHDADEPARSKCRKTVRQMYDSLNATKSHLQEVEPDDDYTTTTTLAGACAASIRDRFSDYLVVDGRDA